MSPLQQQQYEGHHDAAEVLWSQQLDRLEVALRRAGRVELCDVLLNPLSRFIASWPGSPGVRERALARRAITDIKACLVSFRHEPDVELWRRIGACRRPELVTHSGAGATMPAVSRVVEPPVARDARIAKRLLHDLVQAGPQQIDDLLADLGEDSEDQGVEGQVVEVTPKPVKAPLVSTKQTHGDTRVIMQGDLQAGLLADIIQLFAQNNETGRLMVKATDEEGAVYFETGEIVDAICGELTGEAAFCRVMQLTQGCFSYERGICSSMTRIFRSVQHLIMDTLREMDEARR